MLVLMGEGMIGREGVIQPAPGGLMCCFQRGTQDGLRSEVQGGKHALGRRSYLRKADLRRKVRAHERRREAF